MDVFKPTIKVNGKSFIIIAHPPIKDIYSCSAINLDSGEKVASLNIPKEDIKNEEALLKIKKELIQLIYEKEKG